MVQIKPNAGETKGLRAETPKPFGAASASALGPSRMDDHTLPPTPLPPEDVSIQKIVRDQWKEIDRLVFDGLPYQEHLSSIEEQLSSRRALFEQGTFNPDFDWTRDLLLAEAFYKSAVAWLPQRQKTRDDFIAYWRGVVSRNQQIVREIGLSGLKTILLLHGAVALGSLSIVAKEGPPHSALLAAKCGLFFAVIGIIALALGQLLMFETASKVSDEMEGKLSQRMNWSALLNIGEENAAAMMPLAWANRMVYGSLIWFCVYAVILAILLVS